MSHILKKKNSLSESSRYHGKDITLAALMKVHYLPYLEHSNIAVRGEGTTQQEKSGYRKNRFMYQYVGEDTLTHAGQRFDHVFQNKIFEATNYNLCRVFIMGNSFAYGFGVEASKKYYTQLDSELRKQGNTHIIPAAVSAINSTQESILFHAAILPKKPDLVVFMDGWNDVMMPMIFGVRPGDPMTMSSLYQKYDSLFFNLLIRLCQNSGRVSRMVTRLIEKDRQEFIKFFYANSKFQEAITQSIVNIYMSNLDTMIQSCVGNRIKFVHVLQPCGDVLWEKYGDTFSEIQRESYQARMKDYPWASLNLGAYLNNLFEQIRTEIKTRTWAPYSYDITKSFSLDHFFDPGHLNNEGHQILKTKMKELIDTNLKKTGEQYERAG